ncbi:RimJ/RimL family protein N-acetyltransferase [Nocardioides sp. BE266]|uniref:GNAT family N-acetyltransferase n=1 Tax=Nocardioides sp. BE266 TaxID=2817725 RepID=UPI002865BA54|nr:GNAT family N-acetyltransferase [Nocardioides sp. BE266]MDR7255153.1 RimJ/RimL family protein N-acetyltransferase [Nocardioides sp. BE266]
MPTTQVGREAGRIALRAYESGDAARVLDVQRRPEVIRWLGDPPHVPMADLDEALEWIERRRRREESDPLDVTRAIVVRATGIVAGTVSVARAYRRNGDFLDEYEVGWHLHPDSTGHGYATEAARLLLDEVFARGLPEVWCGMFLGNEPSRRVAERLGLPFVGVRQDPWYEGESRLYLLTRDEWLAGR